MNIFAGLMESPNAYYQPPKSAARPVAGNRAIDRVLAEVRRCPGDIHSVSESTGLQMGAVSSYMTLLRRQGYLVQVGRSKVNPTRRSAAVYGVAEDAPDGPPVTEQQRSRPNRVRAQ